MKKQTIKKLRIDTWTAEFNSLSHRFTVGSLDDNYCPQDVIDKFWNKYIVLGCRDFLFQMNIAASLGMARAGGWVDDPKKLCEFSDDLRELFMASYLENRYNKNNQKVIFVRQGEDEVV